MTVFLEHRELKAVTSVERRQIVGLAVSVCVCEEGGENYADERAEWLHSTSESLLPWRQTSRSLSLFRLSLPLTSKQIKELKGNQT